MLVFVDVENAGDAVASHVEVTVSDEIAVEVKCDFPGIKNAVGLFLVAEHRTVEAFVKFPLKHIAETLKHFFAIRCDHRVADVMSEPLVVFALEAAQVFADLIRARLDRESRVPPSKFSVKSSNKS